MAALQLRQSLFYYQSDSTFIIGDLLDMVLGMDLF